MSKEVKITGYGVFEEEDGTVFVGYYDSEDDPNKIDEENFYRTELEATQVALMIANEKRADGLV